MIRALAAICVLSLIAVPGASRQDLLNVHTIADEGSVETIAGAVSERETIDGPGAVARFRAPVGITASPDGNLYVTDISDHVIRRVSQAGDVTTFAGKVGESGSRDGVGSEARFNVPYGIEADQEGNLYVADTFNHAVRKVEPDGSVTTVAGSPDSPLFNTPVDITVDGNGTIFVVDENLAAIKRVSASGEVETIARTGLAPLPTAWAIAASPSGRLFFADTLQHVVREVLPGGEIPIVAGALESPGNHDGLESSRLFEPFGLDADDRGRLFIADTGNHAIRIASSEPPPRVMSFEASEARIEPGSTVVLSWSVEGASRVEIESIGEVSPSGSVEVSPLLTTTFHLRASNDTGSVEATTQVVVEQPRRRSVGRP